MSKMVASVWRTRNRLAAVFMSCSLVIMSGVPVSLAAGRRATSHPRSGAGGATQQNDRTAQSPQGGQAAWKDKSLSPDRRADLVIEQMTLDEKIQLVHGAGGFGPPGGAAPGGAGGPGGGAGGPGGAGGQGGAGAPGAGTGGPGAPGRQQQPNRSNGGAGRGSRVSAPVITDHDMADADGGGV